jgi:hypothetical protein
VKTYRDGFEKALTFLASIALGMVTTQGGGKFPTDVVALFNQVFGKPISLMNDVVKEAVQEFR